jgi:two-component system LytT family response regulator
MSYRALVIDDEQLSRRIIRAFLQEDTTIEVVGEAADGPDAVLQILEQRPDLLFLDVQMPGMNGFDVLREIWPHYQPFVVFATAFDSYAIEAFEFSAADYLLKPFDQSRFRQAVERVKKQLDLRGGEGVSQALRTLLAEVAPAAGHLQRVLVKEHRKMFFVKTDDIFYFEAERNYITLHTTAKAHLIYTSLTLLERQLNPRDFTRINRSCIVGLEHIEELEAHFNGEFWVKLRNGKILKWTRKYRNNLQAFHRQP